jgi:hypothetical protein
LSQNLDLIEEIEALRKEMYEAYSQYGNFTDHRIVRISQLLDEKLNSLRFGQRKERELVNS